MNCPVVSVGSFNEKISDNIESSISAKNTEKSSIINVDNNNNNSNLGKNSITDTDIDSSIINLTKKVKNNFLLATQEIDNMLCSPTKRKSTKNTKNTENEHIEETKENPSTSETPEYTNTQESTPKSMIDTLQMIPFTPDHFPIHQNNS